MLVRLLVVALLCDVTMPLPVQPPPLRPDWISPETPLYTPAVALPTGLSVISLLSWMFILPAATFRLSTLSDLFAPGVICATAPDARVRPAMCEELPNAMLPPLRTFTVDS